MIALLLLLICNVICSTVQAEIVTPEKASPKRAIVIGASVGMGKEVAKLLAADGYIVGMAARRISLLEKNQQEISTPTYVMQMDAAKPYEAVDKLNSMIQEMGGLDLLIIAITGFSMLILRVMIGQSLCRS